MVEEIGDFLWYYVRFVSVVDGGFLREVRDSPATVAEAVAPLTLFLRFGASVGDLSNATLNGCSKDSGELRRLFDRVWNLLLALAVETGVHLAHAAASNLSKTTSRWPVEKKYSRLFDNDYPEEEQLPRHLQIEFKENREVLGRAQSFAAME